MDRRPPSLVPLVPFVALAVALAAPWSASARPGEAAPHPLSLEEATVGSVAPGESRTYSVEVEAGTFVAGRVDQKGVDVVVRTSGPDGARLGVFDGSARGTERFQLDAEAAGTYQVLVEAAEAAEPSGDGAFDIAIERIEPIAEEPPARLGQVFYRWDRPDGPGVVVGVVDHGKLVLSDAFGVANLTHGVPLTPATLSNVGSISKQFTAMAMLVLEKDGELSLDDPLRKHLPEVPDFGTPLTIRHVLHHTTGLREIVNGLMLAGWEIGDTLDTGEVLALVESQPTLQFQPGTEHTYNNTGFLLLAEVVERVTGEPFDTWMKAHVFEPLGMHDTLVKVRPGQVIPGSAQGYVPADSGGFTERQDIARSYGAGGIYSTVSDLARWIDQFREPTLVSPEAMAEMTTPFVLPDGESTDYGMGIAVDLFRGLRRIWHNGGDSAHTAMVVFLPEPDVGVILLGNTPGFAGMGRANEVLEAFFADRLPAEEPATSENAEASEPATSEEAEAGEEAGPVVLPAALLDRYAGRFALEQAGIVITFVHEGDDLLAEIPGRPRLALVPITATELALEGTDARIEFHTEGLADDAPVERATLHQNGELTLRRLIDWQPSAEDLAAFDGRYFSAELETLWSLAVEDGMLRARHRRLEDPVDLQPKEEDSFAGPAPLVEVRFVRTDDGTLSGFYASFTRTKDVWFARMPAEQTSAMVPSSH